MALDPKGNVGDEALGVTGKKTIEGLSNEMDKGLGKAVKKATELEKLYDKIYKHVAKTTKAQQGGSSSSLGLGSMGPGAASSATASLQAGTYGNGGGMSGGQIAGRVALGVGAAAYGILPSTMSAVSQRLAAEQIAMYSQGSGGARNVITGANAAVGRGNMTSAMGPTLAAGQILSQGGYSQNSLSSRNIMGQLGGMSAASGMSNEAAAGAYASQNGMVLLRLGIRLRDSQGNLRRPEEVVNDLYKRIWPNGNPKNPEVLFSPNSIDHKTVMAAAGGDPATFQLYASMLILRHKNKAPLTQKQMGSAKNTLETMGIKNSVQASNFNFQSSENRLLQATESGAVAGYQGALGVAAGVNNGMAALGELLPPVVNGLAALKGVLETMPMAGNAGATVSGATGALTNALMMKMMLGRVGPAGSLAAGTYATGAPAAATSAGMGSRLSGLKGFGKLIPGLGALLSGFGGYQTGKSGQGFSFKSMLTSAALAGGTGALMGAGTGPGALLTGLIGAIIGGGSNAIGQLMGGANSGGGGMGGGAGSQASHENTSNQALLSPGAGYRVSSEYGHRKNPNGSGTHHHGGIDYAMPVGTPVLAAADGVVSTVATQPGTSRSFGLYVVIKHDGFFTKYAHLSRAMVKVGDTVRQGQTIALSGGAKGAPGAGSSTGPHLHFEVSKERYGATQDPKGWFGKAKSAVANLFKSKKDAFKEFDIKSPSSLDSTPMQSTVLGGTRLAELLKRRGSISYSDISGGKASWAQAHGSQDAMDYFMGADQFGVKNENTPVSGDSGSMSFGSRVGLMQALHSRGFRGKALSTAFAVALAESGGRANATNATNDHGLFQINMADNLGKERLAKTWKNSFGSSFKLKGLKDLYNPTINTDVAYHMTKGGKDWSSWVTYNNGRFTNFLDDAEVTARKAGVKVGFYGADRTEEGLTYTHKDEVLMNKMEADRIRNRPVGSGGGGITVNMNVNIERAGLEEVQVLLRRFKGAIQQDREIAQIGQY